MNSTLQPDPVRLEIGHRVVPPFGLNGGEPGQVGRNWIQRQNGTEENLDSTATAQVNTGDVFVIESPGGGRFGVSKNL